jgi:hypothetical protein
MGTLAAAGLALAIFGVAVWVAQRMGRITAERDFHGKAVERAARAQEIDEDVAGRPSGSLDDGLRPFRRG